MRRIDLDVELMDGGNCHVRVTWRRDVVTGFRNYTVDTYSPRHILGLDGLGGIASRRHGDAEIIFQAVLEAIARRPQLELRT